MAAPAALGILIAVVYTSAGFVEKLSDIQHSGGSRKLGPVTRAEVLNADPTS